MTIKSFMKIMPINSAYGDTIKYTVINNKNRKILVQGSKNEIMATEYILLSIVDIDLDNNEVDINVEE